MTVVQILVVAYAKNIIQNGNRNFQTIDSRYVQPVKQYVADNYKLANIDQALVKGFITEEEYTEILSLRTVVEEVQ